MSRRRTKLVVMDPCGARGTYMTADGFNSPEAAAAFAIQFTLKNENLEHFWMRSGTFTICDGTQFRFEDNFLYIRKKSPCDLSTVLKIGVEFVQKLLEGLFGLYDKMAWYGGGVPRGVELGGGYGTGTGWYLRGWTPDVRPETVGFVILSGGLEITPTVNNCKLLFHFRQTREIQNFNPQTQQNETIVKEVKFVMSSPAYIDFVKVLASANTNRNNF